jgi:hypothetical protein
MMNKVLFTAAASVVAAASMPSAASAATSIEFGTNTGWQWKFGSGSFAPVQTVNPANLLTNGTYKPALPDTSWISSGERDASTGLYTFKGILSLSTISGDIQEVLLKWRSDNFVRSVTVNGTSVYNYTGGARSEFGVSDPFEHSFSTTTGNLFSAGNNEFVVTVENLGGSGIDPVALNMSFLGSAVPEPGTWMLMIFGLGAIGFAMRRRQKASVRVQFV